MSTDNHRLALKISGRVQGVCYRDSTKDQARDYGLTGWVKNLPDGRVEAMFEGQKQPLEAMLNWCWKGPYFATVEDIEADWQKADSQFDTFSVRY